MIQLVLFVTLLTLGTYLACNVGEHPTTTIHTATNGRRLAWWNMAHLMRHEIERAYPRHDAKQHLRF